MAESSPELKTFLTARDLDQLEAAVGAVARPLSIGDAVVVTSVLDGWTDRQAVANLLFHPHLIPQAFRSATIWRAVSFDAFPYYQLAVAVGLQGWRGLALGPDDEAKLPIGIMQLMDRRKDVVAARASVTMWEVMGPEHTYALIRFGGHPNATVAHNTIAFVATHIDEERMATHEMMADGASERAVAAKIRAAFDEHHSRPAGARSRWAAPLLAYIPNLDEVVR